MAENKNIQAIRKYANSVGFTIVGELTRHPELEYDLKTRAFLDEEDNEYILNRNNIGVIIVSGVTGEVL